MPTSTRGKTAIDYITVPRDSLELRKSFKVNVTGDTMEEYNLHNLLHCKCQASDRSMLLLHWEYISKQQTETGNKPCSNNKKKKRQNIYNFNAIIIPLLNSDEWQDTRRSLIERLTTERTAQHRVDTIYNDMCKAMFRELDKDL